MHNHELLRLQRAVRRKLPSRASLVRKHEEEIERRHMLNFLLDEILEANSLPITICTLDHLIPLVRGEDERKWICTRFTNHGVVCPSRHRIFRSMVQRLQEEDD
jgi:hypothetical protein